MTKTIHDLAVAYGKEHQGTVDIEVFEAGANAVLEIIYAALFKSIAYKDTFYDVLNAVKELKGE